MTRQSTGSRLDRFGTTLVGGMIGGRLKLTMRSEGQGRFDWVRRLTRMERELDNWQRELQTFGEYMMLSVQRTHDVQGRPAKWAPLAPSTQRERARLGYGASKPILERTRAMRRAYFYDADKNSFSMGNRKFYWIYHQRGTRKMPARITLALQQEDLRVLERLTNRKLQDL